jgi:hypothetical protein
MIDTGAVKCPVTLTSEQLDGWDSQIKSKPGGLTWRKYTLESTISGTTPIHFVYYPPNPGFSDPMLRIETSLSRVLFGDNLHMIVDVREINAAVDIINQSLADDPRIPTVDFGASNLTRIDLTYNHIVGDLVPWYLRALATLRYPQRTTHIYHPEGVQYLSLAASTKLYDKAIESQNPDAAGILRQESTYRKEYYIGRRLGHANPTLRDISKEWVAGRLQQDLDELHLDRVVIYDQHQAHEKLVDRYGHTIADRLLGFMIVRQKKTYEEMIAHGRTVDGMARNERMIEEAGVSSALTDGGIKLPALKIDFEKFEPLS